MPNRITENMIQKYRKKLGCKNIGQVCWCKVCTSIENIVTDTIEEIKKNNITNKY